jgi:hypothetical protein
MFYVQQGGTQDYPNQELTEDRWLTQARAQVLAASRMMAISMASCKKDDMVGKVYHEKLLEGKVFRLFTGINSPDFAVFLDKSTISVCLPI